MDGTQEYFAFFPPVFVEIPVTGETETGSLVRGRLAMESLSNTRLGCRDWGDPPEALAVENTLWPQGSWRISHSPRACPFTVEFSRPWFTVVFRLACKEWATRAVRLSVPRYTAKYMPGWARDVPWRRPPSNHGVTAHRDQTSAHGVA